MTLIPRVKEGRGKRLIAFQPAGAMEGFLSWKVRRCQTLRDPQLFRDRKRS
jgi:hypothetical protein